MKKNDYDFTEIYQAHSGRILNLCYRMVGNEHAARDLSQEIWVKVYKNLGGFEGKSEIGTWLYRISLNHIYNYFKKEKRRRWREVLNLDVRSGFGEEGDILPDSQSKSPLENLQQRELEAFVWQLIQKLPEKQRIPLILFRYEDLSYQEIASVLQVSVNAVESRLHRAKLKMQELLEPYIDKI